VSDLSAGSCLVVLSALSSSTLLVLDSRGDLASSRAWVFADDVFF